MNKLLKILYFFTFIILFYGCNNDFREQNEEYQKEILKRKTNSFEYFKSTDEKIDNTFDRKKFYVPVYSHLYISENNYTRLSISLSIRNSDQIKDLFIESVDYYNTQGELVKKYLSQPHILKPMASIDYFVSLEDMSGGHGAKFLVNVASKDKTTLPIIQAVMLNKSGSSNLCFLSEAHLIK
jgi:hypothetical protein